MKTDRMLWKICDGILFIAGAGMLLIVISQVIGRLLRVSIPWSEEMTRNLFVWIINLGAAVGFRHVAHARVTFGLKLFSNTISNRMQTLQIVLYSVSCLAFYSISAVYGFGMCMRQIRSGEIAPASGIPMFLVTLAIPVCSVLSAIGIIQSTIFDKNTRKILNEVN